MKDELPRIQYANPRIAIEVNRIPKAKEDTWQSSMSMEFGKFLWPSRYRFAENFPDDGSKKTFTMDGKWSSTIFADVMDAAGTPAWDKWKATRKAAKLPIVDSPPKAREPSLPQSTTKKTGAAAVLP